ncbi:hypothetical protein KAR91_57510 [Candidatus Pacearchaeota archaeon]|nr:hypothetical protein [Candidatus Pacearchaeota archaeon]
MMKIAFDIDGTLSIVGDRLKYLQETPPDWDAFYGACGDDELNDDIWEIYVSMEIDHDIYFVTGRRESCREATLLWMDFNLIDCDKGHLLMRANGDKRHDTEVKPELVAGIPGGIDLIFEDRNSMVKKWRELGITCCQVAEGDF